jgi:mono/diheme cytochrome c family protein
MPRPLALTLALLSGCAGVQLPIAQATEPGAQLFNGYVRKEVDCWSCHNGNGLGAGDGPSLERRVPRMSNEAITRIILHGKGPMPKYRARLSDAEVEALVGWLKATFPASP